VDLSDEKGSNLCYVTKQKIDINVPVLTYLRKKDDPNDCKVEARTIRP